MWSYWTLFDRQETHLANSVLREDMFLQSNSNHTRTLDPLHKSLIGVMSKVTNFKERMAIRKTWGLFARHFGARLMFLLGESAEISVNQKVTDEDALYGDILQLNMIDDYYSLTLKSLELIRFAQEKCPSSLYIYKIDDDVIPNWRRLLHDWNEKQLESDKKMWSTSSIVCQTNHKASPDRDPYSKWYSPPFLYPQSTYPDYCAGPTYMFTMKAAQIMLIQELPKAINAGMIYLEDVFATGVLREGSRSTSNQIELIDTKNFLTSKPISCSNKLHDYYFHHSHTYMETEYFWPKIWDNHDECNCLLWVVFC